MTHTKKLFLSIAFTFMFSGVISAQTQADSVTNDTTTAIADTAQIRIVPPTFRGGMEALHTYIMTNFEYPEEARRKSASGTLEVQFTIEASGDVTYVSVLKGIEEDIDSEVLRLLEHMPNWNPATRNEKPVRYMVSMPLRIKVSRGKNGGDRSMF